MLKFEIMTNIELNLEKLMEINFIKTVYTSLHSDEKNDHPIHYNAVMVFVMAVIVGTHYIVVVMTPTV